VTGRDFKMEPATLFDMVGKNEIVKPTLEVIYDAGLTMDRAVIPIRPPTPAEAVAASRGCRSAATAWAATPGATRCWPPRRRPARARRWRSTRDYPLDPKRRPARPAAEHVPGLRLAARGPAHAPHATILSGSACCVYGLTFTSHFYGARRSVGYVPFNSETLVTGKLFEDIRDAVYAQADPDKLRRHRHHQPVRAHRQRRAAATAAQGDQRRAHHRHRRAGLRRAHACRGQGRAGRRDAAYARTEAEAGPVAAPRRGVATSPPSRCWARCSRPTR
jgi:hypothetical protein